MGHLRRDDDDLGTKRLEAAASTWVEIGLATPKQAEELADVVLRVRMQARQIIKQLKLPSINSWTRLVQLLEAALARVEDGQLIEREVPAQVKETTDEDLSSVELVRAEAMDLVWQLEPEHLDGKFGLSQILERALERARFGQWLHSK
ncbi:MAG: hypothetical protein WC348_02365 [Patescibacteria group bacterium]|jgi:hypothetical protein